MPSGCISCASLLRRGFRGRSEGARASLGFVSLTPRRIALAAGDAGAIVVFVLIGLSSHDEGITVGSVLRVLGPILVLWFAAAALFGTYRRPGLRTLVPAWLVAVVGGILVRYAIFRHPATAAKLFTFMGVALAFTLLFLVAWRFGARFLLGVPLTRASPGSGGPARTGRPGPPRGSC